MAVGPRHTGDESVKWIPHLYFGAFCIQCRWKVTWDGRGDETKGHQRIREKCKKHAEKTKPCDRDIPQAGRIR